METMEKGFGDDQQINQTTSHGTQQKQQHTRSNSLASRLSTRQTNPSSVLAGPHHLPVPLLSENQQSQPMQKKSYSTGPIIYPPKSSFDAIRGRFGLIQPNTTTTTTTTTNYQSSYTPSPTISSLGIHRRGSINNATSMGPSPAHPLNKSTSHTANHQKRFSTSTLDSSAYQLNRPPVTASSLMTSTHSSDLQRNPSAPRRRPLSVIDPPSKFNPFPSNSSPDTLHHHYDRSQLEPVNENAGQDPRSYPFRRAHSSNQSHSEADQLIPVGQVEDVLGLHGRLRLTKDLPQSPVSTYNHRYSGGLKLLESQRHLLQAYEYLCHVGEAKDWLELVLEMNQDDVLIPAASPCLSHPAGSPVESSSSGLPNPSASASADPTTTTHQLHNLSVTEFEQTLRDGVILARLARRFRGREHVPRIFIHPKLQYRHSDNINYFFQFLRFVRLPELFIFELVDLYNAKNLPKVIYCIHVLSHLLAKRGLAERIGNLVGKLQFSNDQLEQTNAGLVGKSMPNFGDINKELAKECKEEFEPEVESQSDRIDRELADLLPEVIGLQSQLRGHLARVQHDELLSQLYDHLPTTVALQATLRGHLQRSSAAQLSADLSVNVPRIIDFQAAVRGARCRRKCRAALKLRKELDIWAIALQAASRGRLAQRQFSNQCVILRKLDFLWTALQAHARGSLVRARRTTVMTSAIECERAFTGVQALVRARLMTQAVRERKKRLETVEVASSVVKVQSQIRGLLERRRFFEPIHQLDHHEPAMVKFQSLIRTRLVQAQLGKMVSELMASEQDAIPFQSVCRGALSRRSLLHFIQRLQECDAFTTAFQACCRKTLVQRAYAQKAKALNRVEVTRSVGGLQAFVRAGLIRKKIVNQKKELDFIQPDVVGIQAQCRGVLARLEWRAWFLHVHSSVPTAIFLQSLTRGFLVRRNFFERLMHYHNQMDKVIKVQSVYRARQQASQYKALTRRINVPISAIKAFLHLLSDSDTDFEEEIELSRLRTEVVRLIRDNQQLDGHVNELDTKIALLVKNKITLDEVQRTSGGGSGGTRRRKDVHYRHSVLAAANDPFAIVSSLGGGNLNGSSILFDKATKRKLEIYQEIFYLLQTKPEYLSRLFFIIKNLPSLPLAHTHPDEPSDAPRRPVTVTEKVKKVVEGVVLTLFGYAQMRREEYLLLKLFQRSIHEELAGVISLSEFIMGKFTFINLLMQYGRGAKERRYLKDLLGAVINDTVNDDNQRGIMNIETDPIKIYRSVINEEETRTGIQSTRPLDVTFNEALADQETLALFIKHLQSLRTLTDRFLYAITSMPQRMPFGIRYTAREMFRGLQVKFPGESGDSLAKVVLHMIYYRYLQPAVVAPETYDVVDSVIGPCARKNLSEVSKMLNQITVGRLFADDNPYLVPLNEYVCQATDTFINWFYTLVDVEDAEIHFAVDEYLDHTVSTKPVIYISPNEIYLTHSLVAQDLDLIAPSRDDPLKVLLLELGPAPSAASAELDHARAGEIALPLQNKLTVKLDPEADVKALWLKTKRYVLAMLKVQPGLTLMDAFLAPVTVEHELEWARIVAAEIESERTRKGHSPLISSSDQNHASHTLEDVHSLSFQELKARTLENVLALEKRGKLDREDNYQGILDSLANDILQRNRKRIQRRIDSSVLVNTLLNLKDKQKYLEDQEAQYHSYISDSMAAMQKKGGNKKRFIMPFTPQWHHLRTLEKQGRKPKFGSYKYSAQRLYEKGILLAAKDFSPKQFDKLFVIISCDEVGIFKLELRFMDRLVMGSNSNSNAPATTTAASSSNHKDGIDELRMEDLLEDQFSGKQSLNLDTLKLNLNLLLHLINRK
ncbi:hypothetical protein PCASD_14368 [Puccinia coronata f. sp. avenae]|uniref:Ras-GAP domain-containing protein n=1 Tax=Puccinia coronata f. sp. avenae TaxID=200324 RepID=A0A2N5UCR5_9BASI|nr:hypothetical protein PCASD_14368 [Puccinia coronata f. sp. avenae]